MVPGSSVRGLLAHMKELCRRETIAAGLDVSIFVQICLKMLSVSIIASQGILFAWYDKDSGGIQVCRRYVNTRCVRHKICFFPLNAMVGNILFCLFVWKSLGKYKRWIADETFCMDVIVPCLSQCC